MIHYKHLSVTRVPFLALALALALGQSSCRYRTPRPANQGAPASEVSVWHPMGEGLSLPVFTETRPFRSRYPALDNRFRLRGVHYFHRGWPYTFWDSLRLEDLPGDFSEIRSYGFNTIVLFMSWGKFQTTYAPPTYDEQMFQKLDAVIEAAKDAGLWVVLRVGTPEHVPRDLPDGGPYRIPDLMFEPTQINAMADLFMETSRRVSKHENVYGLFNSWEDFSQYLTRIGESEARRLEFENRRGLFRAYLRRHGKLEEWNAKWETSYTKFDEIPLPAPRSPVMATYVDFISEYINSGILSRMKVKSGTGLGYELRLDKEPVLSRGEVTWHGYEKGFRLPPQYSFVAAYYNPFWSAPNDGGFITPDFAVQSVKRMISTIESNGGIRPIFMEQLNLADDTPGFTRTNSKLKYPHDEAEAARLILPLIFRRTIGYSLWTFRDYAGNVIADSAFLAATGAWKTDHALAYHETKEGAKLARFAPGVVVDQDLFVHVNPGLVSGVPYRFDLFAAVNGSKDGDSSTLHVALTAADDTVVRRDIVVNGPAERLYRVIVPEAGPHPKHIRVEADPANAHDVLVREVRLWNHMMATGVVDLEGEPRRSRASAYRESNLLWQLYESGAAVPAGYDTWVDAASCRSICSGVYEDGWIGSLALVPLYVPAGSGTVSVSYYLPEKEPGLSGIHLRLRWLDSSKTEAEQVYTLKPGRNTLTMPVGTRGIVGDRMLVIEPDKTFKPSGGDTRDLSVLFERAEYSGLKPLAKGAPFRGGVIAKIDNADANRVIVKGRVNGSGRGRVAFHIRGHEIQTIDVIGGSPWEVTLPLWKELMNGKNELFITTELVSGEARVVVDQINAESERTPNPVFR